MPSTRVLSIVASLCWTWGAAAQPEIESLEKSERAVREQPASESNRISLATLYLQMGRNRNATETLQDYLKARKGSPAVLKLLALSSLRQEDYPSVKIAASQAVALVPEDASALYLLGMAELGLQDTKAGERLLRASLRRDPESVESNFQLGLLLTKQREHLREAILLLQKASGKQPDSAAIQTALGAALLESERPEDAVRCLQAAVDRAPESGEPWYLLAQAFRLLHQDRKAEQALQRFNQLKTAEADRRAREMRSRALYEEGLNILTTSDDLAQLDKAAGLFSQAIAQAPDFDAGYYRKAQVNYLQNDFTSALASIRQALKLNSVEPEYYYVQAKCLEATDKAAALVSVRNAVALRPGVPDFEELLHRLEKKN